MCAQSVLVSYDADMFGRHSMFLLHTGPRARQVLATATPHTETMEMCHAMSQPALCCTDGCSNRTRERGFSVTDSQRFHISAYYITSHLTYMTLSLSLHHRNGASYLIVWLLGLPATRCGDASDIHVLHGSHFVKYQGTVLSVLWITRRR